MKELWNGLQALIALFGGSLGLFLGGLDGLLYTLVLFICLDYVTGVMAAIMQRRLSSSIGFEGIVRKVVIFILVGIAHAIDISVLGRDGAIRSAVIFFYLSNEGISIIENATQIGLPIPRRLQQVLKDLQAEEGKNKT